MRKLSIIVVVLLGVSCCFGQGVPSLLTPFQGYGANAVGGVNVVHVTNLNASGAGSLNACAAVAHNYCVFNVSGTINVGSTGVSPASFTTIDGFSAPSPGITITGGIPGSAAIQISAHDVIVQGLRFRNCTNASQITRCIWVGDNPSPNEGTLGVLTFNVVIDHNDMAQADNKLLDVAYAHDVTTSWNVERNDLSGNHGGCEPHLFGSTHITTHHSLFFACGNSSGDSRTPLMSSGWSCCGNASGSETTWPGQPRDLGLVGDSEWNVASQSTIYGGLGAGDYATRSWGNFIGNYYDFNDVDHARNGMQFQFASDTQWYLAGNAFLLNPSGAPSWYYSGPNDQPGQPQGVFCTTNSNTIACNQQSVFTSQQVCQATSVNPTCQATTPFTIPNPVLGPCAFNNAARITEWTNVINTSGVVSKFPDDATDTAIRNGVTKPTTALLNQTWNQQTGSCSSATLTSITLSPTKINLYNAQFQTVAAACLWSDSTTVCPTLTWISDTPAVATVSSSGVVTGVSVGTAAITATANSVTSNAVTITEFGPSPAISVGVIAQGRPAISGQVAMR